MPQSTVQLFTQEPPSYQVIAALLKVGRQTGQQFELLPLEQLVRDKQHNQRRLIAERIQLQRQLEQCLDFIQLAECRTSFGENLIQLRRERDAHEIRIATIDKELGMQEGGQNG